MRVTVLVLAIIGGALGILFGFLALIFGLLDEEFTGDRSIIWLGISALAASVAGIVFGSMSFGSTHQKIAALGLIASAIWHVVSISLFGIPGMLFLLLAGVLGFFVKRPRVESTSPPDQMGES